jgi:L-amino acid N-acyltransferase YncA
MAEEEDVPGILAILNDVILHTTAVYSDRPETLEERLAWMRHRRVLGFPVLVAKCVRDGAIIGFASFGDFRGGWAGFRNTVEHSVHVRADARGRGVGQTLVGTLIEQARAMGKHIMVASVDAANERSLCMHEKLGFVRVAHMPQVGCKFGRWLDLVMLQVVLSDSAPC